MAQASNLMTQVGRISLIIGMRSIRKGMTDVFKGVLATRDNRNIKTISKGSSHNWSIKGIGIRSRISIERAKKIRTIPPGERRTSLGIF